jgi:hypothetical protein
MSTALSITNPVRVRLLAPASIPILTMAAAVLARHLHLSESQALDRLQHAPGSLAGGLSADHARRLARILLVLGLRVRTEPETAAPLAEPCPDLSLQASAEADPNRLSHALAPLLLRDPHDILHDLQNPGGIILRGLGIGDVERFRQAVRRIKGLQLTTCCPDSAEFDLFSRAGAVPDRALLRHLGVLGLLPVRFNGALAGGLNRTLFDHLMKRFGRQVFGLERSFQRLDLFLTGPGDMAPLDLADFLATRHLGGGRVVTISMVAPLRIETGLSYGAARQFQTDYEMIGLSTVARLTHPDRPAQNP